MIASIWDPHTILLILVLGLLVDAVVGDPDWLWRRVVHPVVTMGALVTWGERRLNRATDPPDRRRQAGMVLVIGALAVAAVIGGVVSHLLALVPGGWLIEGVIVAVILAQRSLYAHVRAVERAFADEGLDAARLAVAHIVGRDPDRLDEAGICRAAIESLAENHSDGIVAPVFWYLLFGLPGLLAYKMLNTADSMIGYRNDKYGDFGWAAARLDDLANFLPARFDALLITAAAIVVPSRRFGAGASLAWEAARQDGPRHHSVNAGWPEAAMAGALGLALAGPRIYDDSVVEDAWMNGNGDRSAKPEDIRGALRVTIVATALLWSLIILALLIVPGRS